VDWDAIVARETARYEDGRARWSDDQLVRMGNAAYGAGLALLMLGRDDEAEEWLVRAAARWRGSWEHAAPEAWGRPVGALKAALIAGRDEEAEALGRWTLELGAETVASPIGRYAGALALLAVERWKDAAPVAAGLDGSEGFPSEVARALVAIARDDHDAYAAAIEAVLVSFETRESYLEDVPVADTVLALQALAAGRGLAEPLRPSPVLP
jgi:hypothetical protein